MNEQRIKRLKAVAFKRQSDLTVILENVIDPHNMSAVVRSCDAVGISDIYMIYSEKEFKPKKLKVGKVASGGSRKWVDVHLFLDIDEAFETIKKKYNRILATHMNNQADSIYSVDLTAPTAWLFGNEKEGISEKALSYADQNVVIPQMGMVNSLNISVACAISLFESSRQRQLAGMYDDDFTDMIDYRKDIFENYINRSKEGHVGRSLIKGKKIKNNKL